MTVEAGAFSPLGFDGNAAELGHDVVSGRAWLSAQLATALPTWQHYDEPPEQLANGPCCVVAPRDPYQSWEGYMVSATHLTVHLLVPRARRGSMDLLDPTLAELRVVLSTMQDAQVGDSVGIATVDDTGGAEYIAASVDVDLLGGQLT